MQNTLLGLAIAIILALVAALVGPLLIDWGTHRSLFEAEASRLIGVEVRVTGPIEARLLPTPSLTLHDIEIGDSSKEKVRARLLGFEFALGPLMRGEWRASEVYLVGPKLSLGLDASGQVKAPNLAIKFNADNLSIDRLSVEDGTVSLSDTANGARATLQGFGSTARRARCSARSRAKARPPLAASFIRFGSRPAATPRMARSNCASMSIRSAGRSASSLTAC